MLVLPTPHGIAVDGVCLRTVPPQAQKDTPCSMAVRRLRSLDAPHDGSDSLKRATTKGDLLSCASQAPSSWPTALPIHNVHSAKVHVAMRSSFDWDSPPGHASISCALWKCRPCGPTPGLRCATFSSITLKSAPNLSSHGLRAAIFSVGLGAKSCDRQGSPPRLSPTMQKLHANSLSPPQAIGQISSPSYQPACG
jgi:hypothetical protein